SLPGVYLQILEELRRVDTSVSRVAELISQDIGMTAKVLQLVNSSFFGLSVHVQDVTHAAALLGLNALRPLVLSAGVFRQLEESKVPAALVEEVLNHSLAVGQLGKQIAEAEGLDRESADNAMLAGILHDVGKLVLADYFGQNYSTVCLAAKRTRLPLLEAELDQFDASHADVGGFLLGLWGLPQELIEAVAFHHDPGAHAVTDFTPLSAVHVANALTHEIEALDPASAEEGSPEAPLTSLDMAYLTSIGCGHRLEAWRSIAADAFSHA
ncbi:MAG: HDOD domain-containing protein, partial [Planctomycetota bacterium]